MSVDLLSEKLQGAARELRSVLEDKHMRRMKARDVDSLKNLKEYAVRISEKIDARDNSSFFAEDVVFESMHVVCRILALAKGFNKVQSSYSNRSDHPGTIDCDIWDFLTGIIDYEQVFREVAKFKLDTLNECLSRLAAGRRLQPIQPSEHSTSPDPDFTLPTPLCTLCRGIEDGNTHFEPEMPIQYWERMVYPHHKSLVALRESAHECALCAMIMDQIRKEATERHRISDDTFETYLLGIQELENGTRQPIKSLLPEQFYRIPNQIYPSPFGNENGQIYLSITGHRRFEHNLNVMVCGRPSADIFPECILGARIECSYHSGAPPTSAGE